MSATSAPAHLLFPDESFTDYLVHRRSCEGRRDRFSITIAIVIIGDGGLIGTVKMVKVKQGSHQLPCFWAGPSINVLVQPLQQLQCFIDVTVSEKPFHPLQFFLELLSLMLNQDQFSI